MYRACSRWRRAAGVFSGIKPMLEVVVVAEREIKWQQHFELENLIIKIPCDTCSTLMSFRRRRRRRHRDPLSCPILLVMGSEKPQLYHRHYGCCHYGWLWWWLWRWSATEVMHIICSPTHPYIYLSARTIYIYPSNIFILNMLLVFIPFRPASFPITSSTFAHH